MDDLKMEVEYAKSEYEKRQRQVEMDSVLPRLKTCINEFLYPLMPPETTLNEFEDFAVTIYDKIRDLWEKNDVHS